ncbi:QVPTGV class sortase B protein-sorting domain-containing protein [Ruminococcus sp.]|uniref:QVPTGV class sortase B protein-sorting domain-containing protein n=1 Tax=Ruminococcus sp. TaxID=41978 RepID=UPI002E79DB28|nr:QVPTGV class sortase B protein-sorting domain-containing protein [Ruminococcus sp.]MEE1264610.1 QVPTGV class sortase B protein-sorting domain-containing protein [Ruminococcus sp.]
MKRRFTTALVMLLAFALLIGTTAITASAENTYEPIGGSTTLVKNLVVDDDANIPGITFNYTIRRGTPQDATATTIEILESPLGGGSIGTAVFSNADTANTIDGLPTDANPSNPTAGKKYVQKSVSITFPVGTFTKPGVYRFVINETNNNLPGVTYDSNPTRYLDVFVVADDNNVLSVNSYVLRDAATDIGTNGEYVEDPGVKSSGYTNSLTQYNFDFSKTISGNQGDKNKRFNFTLNITGANPGTYPIIANDVEGNPTSIIVGTDGTASAQYSLTNGSTVQVIGLNQGAVCTVTEDAEDYTATHSLDGNEAVSGNSSGAVTLNSDHSVAFTNTRNGVIPTGVIMTIAPFAIGICVFGAIIIFIICRRKRRNY